MTDDMIGKPSVVKIIQKKNKIQMSNCIYIKLRNKKKERKKLNFKKQTNLQLSKHKTYIYINHKIKF